MADEIKISELPTTGSAQLTDVFPGVQSGTTYKESLLQVQTLFNITASSTLQLGKLGIGLSVETSSILSLSSTSLGFLPPRMNQTQRDAIVSPATGLVIYNTSDNDLETYNGSAWIGASSSGVTSLFGTSNQINVSSSTGSITISISSTLQLPGTLYAPYISGFGASSISGNQVTIVPSDISIGTGLNLSGFYISHSDQYGIGVFSTFIPSSNSLDVYGIACVPSIVSNTALTVNDAFGVYVDMVLSSNINNVNRVIGLAVGAGSPPSSGIVNLAYGFYCTMPYVGMATTRICANFTDIVCIGQSAPTPSSVAILQLDSTTKGFLPPRMNQTQRDAIVSPATGLVIYNTSDNDLEVYNGSAWIGASSSGVTSLFGTSNQITVSSSTGSITLSLTNGISLGSYQAISAPTGGIIMPGYLGVGTSTVNAFSAANMMGNFGNILLLAGTAQSVVDGSNNQSGLNVAPIFAPTSGATISSAIYAKSRLQIPFGQTISKLASVYATNDLTVNSGSITNLYGFYFDGGGAPTLVTNSYGGYFTIPGGGTNKAAIYGDNLSIGYAGTNVATSNVIISGHVGINTNAPVSYANMTISANTDTGILITGTNAISSFSIIPSAITAAVTFQSALTSNLVGIISSCVYKANGGVTVNIAAGVSISMDLSTNAGTIGLAAGLYIDSGSSGTGTIPKSYGIYCVLPTGGAQNIAANFTDIVCIGTTSPVPETSAILQLDSGHAGFLPPRMTTSQKNAISAIAGLVLYDNILNDLQYYNGSAWVSSSGVTSLAGTSNQITASASTGSITLSLPSAVSFPGTVTMGSTITLSGLTASTMLLLDGSKNIVSLAPGTAGKVAISNGTTWVASTPTFPNASATSGKIIASDGTNWIASTPTFPNASATSGKIIVSDGTNWIASTPTFPNASATTGKIIRSNGTNWLATTSTFADTYAINTLLYNASASTVSGLATANSAVLVTDGSGIPSLSTTLPNINIGTPSAGVATNLTGTAVSLTVGKANTWTTARNLAGNSVDGSANVAFSNKFIVQGTSDAGLSAAQFLGALATGIVKNTTTTGVLSIAVAADFPTLNQNTTGSAATLTTARNIWGQSFNGSADITGSLTSVGDITGGASSMTITAGTGNSRTLTLRSTTSGGTATAFLTGNADQSSTFGGNISGTGAWTLTGGAGNMTIVSGTGASRTMIFQTTTSGSTATTALTLAADQSATFANTVNATTFVGALTGNASTASSAAKWTTARNLAGNSVDGSTNVTFANKFIVQGTTDTGLSAAQFLGSLSTGIVKNTTTTGVLSIAAAATDYVAPSAYASSNGLTMSTARLLGRTTASTGAAEEITVGTGLSLSSGTLTSTGSGGTVTSTSVVSANGFAGSVATATTTPAITLSTTVSNTAVLYSTGTAIAGDATNFNYDSTNHYLGINWPTPASPIDAWNNYYASTKTIHSFGTGLKTSTYDTPTGGTVWSSGAGTTGSAAALDKVIGYTFTVGATQLYLTHLGFLQVSSPSIIFPSGTRTIGLYNAGGSLVASVTVSSTDPVDNSFVYGAISSGITLAPGTTWTILATSPDSESLIITAPFVTYSGVTFGAARSDYSTPLTYLTVNNLSYTLPLGPGFKYSLPFDTLVVDNRAVTINGSLSVTAGIGVVAGGTGITSYAVGDIIYASASTTLSKLADVATGNALISGGVTTAPSWGKIGLTTHVSGTLAAGNGGTGITSLGTGIATWLGTPSSANLISAMTDETGTGALVFATSPTLVTPLLGTPTSGVLTNCTGIATGLRSGFTITDSYTVNFCGGI